eukprot:scaffold32308_cov73-Skeletonema_marinoi.AAC.1
MKEQQSNLIHSSQNHRLMRLQPRGRYGTSFGLRGLFVLNIMVVANASPGDDILDTGSRMSSPVDNPPGMSWDATKATSQSIKFLGKILDQNETVNSNVLASWLSDVINGVRGDGEAALRYDVDILQSEALETFLFRHAEALND